MSSSPSNDIIFKKYTETPEQRQQIDQLLTEGKWSSRFLFYSRLVYDISLIRFLQYYLIHFGSSLLPSDDALRKEVANAYSPQHPEQVLTTLSVRTFFDCYFRAAEFPRGSEILFSGMSIPQMRTIAEYHGLTIRAFDIDLITFQADVEQARQMINNKTKLIVVAPCYGTHLHRIKEIQDLAREHNIPLFLDLAQAWGVLHKYRDIDADATAISFGAIKYQTALGGCVATVKDPVLRNKISDIEKTLPTRSWESQLGVIVKNSAAVMLANDAPSTALVRNVVNLAGHEWTAIVNKLSRGFPGPNLIELIRRRPHKSLLKMLALRLGEDSSRRARHAMKIRTMSGWDILARLPNYIQIVGAGDPNVPEDSTFWLFPMYCSDAIAVNAILHANGIDSALGTSQMCSMGGGIVAHENDDQKLEKKGSTTPKCDKFMQNILYLPAYPAMGERGRDILLKTLHSMPRKMCESPDPEFHKFVERSEYKHAYRSKAVEEMLKDRPLFVENVPKLFAAAAIGASGTALPKMISFALKSHL